MTLFRLKRKEHTTSTVCPRALMCPLFKQDTSNGGYSSEKYKKIYCEAGIKAYSNCKKYIIYNLINTCPNYVMPNSSFSVDEIISRIKRQSDNTFNI